MIRSAPCPVGEAGVPANRKKHRGLQSAPSEQNDNIFDRKNIIDRTIKVFEKEINVYSGNCSVNTVIFRGRISNDLREVSKGTAKFSLQLSNGNVRRGAAANSRSEISENQKFDNT